ncbi:MAG: VOC family protein [Myxococcales bacterium]|nr:VOC family protein [Myxococcales bacterium]HQY61346.1 VOC family protein [Polyangiaceae bacterium]
MRVHHLAFRTRDLERLEAFYATLLGLPVARRSERSVWLDAEGTLVMLELAGDDEPDVPRGSMEIAVFEVAPEERAERVERLRDAGFPVEAETEFTTALRDPDGRRVGLSHYPHPRPHPRPSGGPRA